MLVERFCTAERVVTDYFHKLAPNTDVTWLEASEDWDKRVESLVQVLKRHPEERTLVFTNTVYNCRILHEYLRDAQWPVVRFSKGPKSKMGGRFADAKEFIDGRSTIMIATELGARGIDWPEVDHVIHFQFPNDTVQFLHRSG